MLKDPSLSFVVVTWECADLLTGLVASMNQHLAGDAELIVVDNASADQPEVPVESWKGQGHFERLPRNLGFGAAANRGVELASADGIVLLNPDTLLLDSGLSALAGFALSNVCLAGPRLLGARGAAQPSASGPPIGWWPWLGALIPGSVLPDRLRRKTEPWRLDEPTRVSWLSGACLAGPAGLLRSLGPFDPTIHMYAEDMDLGLRASQRGVESWFCPQLARVEHVRRGSSRRRWAEGPEAVAACNRRLVIRRTYGNRAERNAWRAERTRLRLRLIAKRGLRRSAEAESRELAALRSAP